ncbi:RNA methyltransferase [Allomuricauda sp. d1]|uniref:TrmH family RNA methyltransferase n=1 Tax=Allomuricauda sp. d1 TaxID=3136725 RepID=UPI0031D9571A
MVTKKQIKLVKGLQQKKYRSLNGLFVVEGLKLVNELLQSDFTSFAIYATSDTLAAQLMGKVELIAESDLEKMSSLSTANGVLGVFRIPEIRKNKDADWVVVLDAVRDPGNLGTIIRLCDWFGIEQVICSMDTVDCYNPKALQATMGSIARVAIFYEDLETYLSDSDDPIFGAFMDGASVYGEQLPEKGILIMGNEANGISASTEKLVQKRLAIPQFGKPSTESLNVATATAILLSEVRRAI